MQPAIRIQMNYDVQKASDETIAFGDPDEIPVTRAEFAADCDITNILRRGGVPTYTRQPMFGEIDFSQNLATAISEVRLADTLFEQLPSDLREEYKNRNNLVRALQNGQITAKLKAWLTDKPKATQDTSAELLKWLEKNHTAPASSPSNNTDKSPAPQSAAAATSGKTDA